MNYSEDHIALAAEYALGTLDADERALVETMMIVDHGFMEVVEAWDRKLSPLHQMVAPIEPPPHVWEFIKLAAGLTGRQAAAEPEEHHAPEEPVVVAEQAPPPLIVRQSEDNLVFAESPEEIPAAEIPPAVAAVPEDTGIVVEPPAVSSAEEFPDVEPSVAVAAPEIVVEPVAASNVVPLPKRRYDGVFGLLMTGIAAALAGVIALQAYRPDLLPEQLRVKPKIQVVEVAAPAPAPSAQFVAVLQQNASAPAFILTVDTATKNFTVRKVGAVAEPGKSYELWLVSDKLQRPRSLGVIGGSDFTIRPALAAYDSDTINRATYAVTVEPEGGSPTGVATGPIVYTGRLVESVPSLPAANAPR